MRFFIILDHDPRSGLNEVLDEIDYNGMKEYFQNREYGSDNFKNITIIFMCRNQEFQFHKRIELSKIEKKLYIDLIFDLNEMMNLDLESRLKLVAKMIIQEIPLIISRYIKRKKIINFDLKRFTNDLTNFFEKIELKKTFQEIENKELKKKQSIPRKLPPGNKINRKQFEQILNVNWDFYFAEYENGPGSIILDMSLNDLAPIKDFPILVVAGVTFSNCSEYGLPNEDEIINLNIISDCIIKIISNITKFKYAGVFTYQCEQLHYIYVKEAINIKEELTKLFLDKFKEYKYYINIKNDTEWEAYLEFLFPNEETRQWMEKKNNAGS
jgi:hypothetical protein